MNACSAQVSPRRTQTYTAPTEPAAMWAGKVSMSQSEGLMPPFRQLSSAVPPAIVLPSSLIAPCSPEHRYAAIAIP